MYIYIYIGNWASRAISLTLKSATDATVIASGCCCVLAHFLNQGKGTCTLAQGSTNKSVLSRKANMSNKHAYE